MLNAAGTRAYAFIPGIAMDAAGNAHAFIQVLDGKLKTAVYHRFDSSEFQPAADRFYEEVGKNHFSSSGISLNLEGVSGLLQFSGNVGWPKPFYSPRIMGHFSFFRFRSGGFLDVLFW